MSNPEKQSFDPSAEPAPHEVDGEVFQESAGHDYKDESEDEAEPVEPDQHEQE